MKAVIVAAGMGTRLHPLTLETPKCLLKVSGRPIIDVQLLALKKNGIKEVVVVTGFLEKKIREHLQSTYSDDFKFTFVSNLDYQISQNAYSLFLARDILTSDDEGFIILNSDLLFPSKLLNHLITHKYQDGMIVDEYTNTTSDMVKVVLEKDRIVHMSKQLASSEASAEAVGPVKFSKQGGIAYFNFLEQTFKNEGIKNWLFYTLGDFGRTYPFYAIKNPGLTWAEIDTLEDHSIAEVRSKDIN